MNEPELHIAVEISHKTCWPQRVGCRITIIDAT